MQWIISLITGGFFNTIKEGYVAKLAAGNTQERIVADLVGREADLQMKESENASRILIAEQGNWLTRSVRPLMAIPAVALIWKILLWDLALGQWTDGSTDKLSPQAFWLLTTIVVAYMGGRTIEKTAGSIADAIRKR